MGGSHVPHGHRHPSARGRLLVAMAVTLIVLIVQVFGSWLSGSLALLADAGHLLADVSGIGLAVLAATLSARPATARRTYGYHRAEVLAALVNAMLLIGLAAFLLIESWQRWGEAPDVRGVEMVVFAVIGLLGNLIVMGMLHGGAHANLNVRGAYLHAFGDALGSIAVIGAALVIITTGWQRADVIASAAVALLILPRAFRLLGETVDVLLEATPRGIDLADVQAGILRLPGVIGAHDLHVWQLTSGLPVLSVHVVVTDEVLADGGGARLLDALGECLAEQFDVEHCTFQLEPVTHAAHERACRV